MPKYTILNALQDNTEEVHCLLVQKTANPEKRDEHYRDSDLSEKHNRELRSIGANTPAIPTVGRKSPPTHPQAAINQWYCVLEEISPIFI